MSGVIRHQLGALYSCTITVPSVRSNAVSVWKVGWFLSLVQVCACTRLAKVRTPIIPSRIGRQVFMVLSFSRCTLVVVGSFGSDVALSRQGRKADWERVSPESLQVSICRTLHRESGRSEMSDARYLRYWPSMPVSDRLAAMVE